MTAPRTPKIPYGGDYSPEQWPETVWDDDHRLFTRAGIDTLTVGVFTWSLTQPAPDTYDFTVLDRILDRAAAEHRQVCLATGTAALPPWLAKRHPEVNRTDFEGRRHRYGQRHNFCPSSPAYREHATVLASRLAERYADHPALLAWHINNEYGGACYCELCAEAFREWLRDRHGTLDALNDSWWTTFWSHRYTDWDQIEPPNALTEHWRGPDHTAFQGITLDYFRFTTDALLGCFLAEKEVIRAHDPDTPVTTNFMGIFRPLDYHRWAPHLDFASWDNYPPLDAPPTRPALAHDLMRGLKDGAPFWLMEQTPSTTACRDVNPLRRPGELRLATFQAIAHGADAALYFQMRASRGACEKYHGAVIGHAGRDDTRMFREVAELGRELESLGEGTLGARTPARTALLFDWDSWWALEISDGPSRLVKYPEMVHAYYRAAREAGADVDVIPQTADLTPYDVVLAPALHMVKGDLATRLEEVAARGGTVLASFLSGRVDEHDRAFLTDVPGPLAPLMGIRVDEWDARPPEFTQPIPDCRPRHGSSSSSCCHAAPNRSPPTAPTSTPAPPLSPATASVTARAGTSPLPSTSRASTRSSAASWPATTCSAPTPTTPPWRPPPVSPPTAPPSSSSSTTRPNLPVWRLTPPPPTCSAANGSSRATPWSWTPWAWRSSVNEAPPLVRHP
ncbi:beta-galactosidase [Streptomyces azureus]|uniref:beta-galactosidase n=1 Tax=Streptomyces azureus TaxID=146537 RepID=A0A0K8PSN8_STRAJ|nr:beta-galactosidase [Streptomyces azureus]